MDELKINHLKLPVYIGVSDIERSRVQDLKFDVIMRVSSIHAAASSDRLDETVDIDQVVRYISEASQEFNQSRDKKLMEGLAEYLANGLLNQFTLIQSLSLNIEKQEHSDRNYRWSVCIERKRN